MPRDPAIALGSAEHPDAPGEARRADTAAPTLSVIVPYFNELEALPDCHRRLLRVLAEIDEACEIVYVDDGSDDGSAQALAREIDASVQPQPPVQWLGLSRNFGKEAALSAGLAHARGRAVVILDADLQDPPELLPAMLRHWRRGFDVVEMRRRSRAGESLAKRATASAYYRLMNWLCDTPIPANVGDFRLLDRRVVDVVNRLPERSRYMKGLLAWPGYRRCTLDYDRDPRVAGNSKWNYPKLLNLAFEGITSFSIKPLRVATVGGALVSLAALALAAAIVVKTLLFGDPVPGYPSLISAISLLGGIQLLAIGLLGEYVGRLFVEAKQRPLYLVAEQREYGDARASATAREPTNIHANASARHSARQAAVVSADCAARGATAQPARAPSRSSA